MIDPQEQSFRIKLGRDTHVRESEGQVLAPGDLKMTTTTKTFLASPSAMHVPGSSNTFPTVKLTLGLLP